MTGTDLLRTAWAAIRAHRLRSMLTALGILIGIAAVVLTVGLGQGAQQQVASQLSALGGNLLIVSPGSSTSGGVRGGFGTADTLTAADASALSASVAAPDVAAVAPVSSTSEAELVAGSSNWTTTVVGTTPSWATVRNRAIAAGHFLTAGEQRRAATAVVLGSDTASELFGRLDPVGQQVTIGTTGYTVVGVLAAAGSDSTTDLDDQAVIPLSTAQQRVTSAASATAVQTIYVKAAAPSRLSAAYQEVDALLTYRHHLAASDTADFTITTQQSVLTTTSSVNGTLDVLLIGIAALSLLVGGIGVMNIMLVSVRERTREIGLRKALGATPAVIRRQFLTEASMLGLTGGLLGVAAGVGAALVLPTFISDPVAVSAPWVVAALVVAVAIGVGFGVYPAARAARLSPIDALRSD